MDIEMERKGEKKVLIISCSGVGKACGLASREAMYTVVEDLRPGVADTLCLSLLTLGDEEARARVRTRPTITIDGCPRMCARSNVEASGRHPAAGFRVVVLDPAYAPAFGPMDVLLRAAAVALATGVANLYLLRAHREWLLQAAYAGGAVAYVALALLLSGDALAVFAGASLAVFLMVAVIVVPAALAPGGTAGGS